MKLYSDINYLQLLGKGTQGKVYKVDEKTCIKVFKRKNYCENVELDFQD